MTHVDYASLGNEVLWALIYKGDEGAIQELLVRFDRVIVVESRIAGKVNEDVAQDVRERLFVAIKEKLIGSNNATTP